MNITSLTPSQYKVAAYLLSVADTRFRVSVDRAQFAEELGMSPSQVSRVLKSLTDSGVIERIRKGFYVIPEEDGDSRINAPTSRTNAPISRINAPQKVIQTVDSMTTTSRTTSTNSDNVLTSYEVSTGAARPEREKRGKIQVRYDDDDVDLQSVGQPPTPQPKRKKQNRRSLDHVGKPREDWTVYDAARFFADTIEAKRPQLFGRVAIRRFEPILKNWLKDKPHDLPFVIDAMSDFLNNTAEMNKLTRGSDPMRQFLGYLKAYKGRPDKAPPSWASAEETARIFDPKVLEES